MKHIVSWWVKNPIAANLVMLSFIVMGCISYSFWIEKEPFPITKSTTMEVNMRWLGAGPQEIEDQIIVRFEDAVKNVEGIESIVSRAVEGRASVLIKGSSRIDRRKFSEEIREKINSVNSLPADADRPVVTEKLKKQEIIRIALHGNLEQEFLAGLALDIRRQVASLPLTSDVKLTGQGRYEITIELTEQAMNLFGISIDEVSSALKNASVNVSAGVVRDEAGVLMLSVRSRANYQQEFEDIIIRQQRDGATLRLKDIALIKDGMADTRYRSRFDGEPAILIDVMNGDYMNIPKISDYVHDYVNRKNTQLPEGVKLTIWSDWNQAYQSRLSTIFSNALGGLVLVFILLMLFLQPKIAFWVTAGIATTFTASFALLPSYDVSLNMISLFAFLMVIGIVVDDAIVIGESIHVANEQGLEGEKSAVLGVTQVAKPVVFGVLTTIVIFAPMAFLPGNNAEFARSIAVVIILSLVFSLFEALCILPAHLSHLSVKESENNLHKLKKIQKRIVTSIDTLNKKIYLPFIHQCIKHKYSVVLFFVGTFFIGLNLLSNNYITRSFMPQIADDKIRLSVTLPSTTTHERMLQVLKQITIGQEKLLAYVDGLPKSSLVEHDYTQLFATKVVSEIKLVPFDERSITIEQAAEKLQYFIGEIPDAEEVELKSTLNVQEPRVGFSFTSKNIQALKAGITDFKQKLSTYDGIYLLRDNMDKGSQEMVFSLKPGTEALGLSIREISKQVKQAYFGQEVQRLPREGGDIRVKVMYSRSERESIDSLANLKIRTRDGRSISLMSVVNIEIRSGIQRIVRKDSANFGFINAEYAGNDKALMLNDIKQNFLPQWQKRHPEVNFGRGERVKQEDEFTQTIIVLEGVAIMLAYILMAIAFSSYTQPLLIMSAIPFGFLGALIGHLIHDISFGMFSMLGILAASGVVINDNLVLIDAINRNREKGRSPLFSVLTACKYRFRPILLTSITTFAGLMPMLSESSVQAQFLVPMVLSLAYGVLAATVTTLVFVPCIYLISTNIHQFYCDFYKNGKYLNIFRE